MTTKKISELPDASALAGTELVPVVQDNATRKATVDGIRSGLSADGHNHTLADITDAGTAAAADTGDFATAAQGALADTALQNPAAFATAAQGATADTAVQPGDLAAVATSGDYDDLTDAPNPGFINGIINGGCMVSHRGDLTLDNTWQYGAVDLLAVKAEGTVSNGTIKRLAGTFSLTQTGFACMVENATLNASGAVLFRHRIESRDARAFANLAAHYSARVYHDAGVSVDFIITIRKANAEDDFSATTQIDTDTVAIAHDTNSDITLAVADMGDCRNGIEIEVKADCGAVTTKDFFLAEQQLSTGTQKPFEQRPFALEQKMVHRFLRPISGLVGVANSASNMQTMFTHPDMRATPTYEVTGPLNMTDAVAADRTQSSAQIGTIHENNKDQGRADIGNFSGMSSGTLHIQRGTGGIILASAEL